MKTRPGSILLECMIAVAIFVAAATTIYSVVVQSLNAAERTARIERAADLARGAISQIEAGIATSSSRSSCRCRRRSGSRRRKTP